MCLLWRGTIIYSWQWIIVLFNFRFEIFLPMHDMWKSYMKQRLHNVGLVFTTLSLMCNFCILNSYKLLFPTYFGPFFLLNWYSSCTTGMFSVSLGDRRFKSCRPDALARNLLIADLHGAMIRGKITIFS